MPRPERPLDPEAGPVQEFAAQLRVLRQQAGNPKYLQMARVSGRSRTALAEAAGGDHLATWETVEAYVRACGADPAAWLPKWERVQEQLRALQDGHLLPSADQPPPGCSEDPIAPPVSQRGFTVSEKAHLKSADGPTLLPEEAESSTRRAEVISSADVLLRMWEEQRNQARQSENQRALITVLIVAVATSALTYVIQHGLSFSMLSVTVPVFLLGVFGVIISLKYYERHQMHMSGAQKLRKRLDELFPELQLVEDWSANRREHEERFSVLYNIKLHYLWTLAHVGIAATGLVLTCLISIR